MAFKKTIFYQVLPVVIVGLSMAAFVFAWTEPTAVPPNGNVDAPLNVGNDGQQKEGGLILNTGGADIGFIVATGTVSIGTSAPLLSTKLYVRDKDNAATADIGQFFAENLTQGIGIGYNRIEAVGSNANQDILLLPKGSGGVGVGVTAPTASMDINGQIKIRGGSPGANKVLTSDANGLASWAAPSSGMGGTGTTNYVAKFTAASTLGNSIIYDNGTNVGIGTASPGYKLQVAGDIYANTGWIRTGGATGWYNETYCGGWYMQDTTWIRSYCSKSIYQDSGILRTDGTFQVGNDGATFSVANGGNFAYRTNTLFANTSDNVGIGTSAPKVKLDVRGHVLAADSTLSSWIELWNDEAIIAKDDSPMRFGHAKKPEDASGWSEKMRIDKAGNVGIGTTNPVAKLDVNGGICVGGQCATSWSDAISKFLCVQILGSAGANDDGRTGLSTHPAASKPTKGIFEAVTGQSSIQGKDLTGAGLRIWVNNGGDCN